MRRSPRLRVVAAPDKFRGTVTARAAAAAIANAARTMGASCHAVPLADGGEGTVDALGGANRRTVVHGPLGEPVEARWRLDGDLAVIEVAATSGLAIVGGAQANDAVRADTRGTGELVLEAVRAGARRVIVALGGSATTDGGAGCVAVLEPWIARAEVQLIAACDVETPYRDAAVVFGPQKGATDAEVTLLSDRLEQVASRYRRHFGVDVRDVPRAGAAGGLGGGLLALGARLVSGFDLVARHVGLEDEIGAASIVITGEGRLDRESLNGKVVGCVLERCRTRGTEAWVIAGDVTTGDVPRSVSLTRRFGADAAWSETAARLSEVTIDILRGRVASTGMSPEREKFS